MRIYNRYIVILILASCVVNVSLSLAGVNDLLVYFVVNTIAYLTITLLYVQLNPRARMALNTISIVLFSTFLVVLALKVMGMLNGR